jgi:hypothetical protein
MNMRKYCSWFTVALLLGPSGAAHAEITIHEARYAAGILFVRGETSQPMQRLTLDGRYHTRTDRNKRFSFKVRYVPRDCIADIRAGTQVHPAVIANCEPTGAPPPSRLPAAGAPKQDGR